MLRVARDVAKLVLVLEEDFAVRESLRFALKMAGINVYAYETVPALLNDSALPQAACLLIGHHPPMFDAFETISRLYAQGIQTPVILITDHAKATLRRRAARIGIRQVIERPDFDSSLVESVKELLEPLGGT